MEVVVLGGHVIVGLGKSILAPPGLARGPVSRWWWLLLMSMYVCDRSLGLSKIGFQYSSTTVVSLRVRKVRRHS